MCAIAIVKFMNAYVRCNEESRKEYVCINCLFSFLKNVKSLKAKRL